MDDYKIGDVVEAVSNMWTEPGAVGVVTMVEPEFVEVRFEWADIVPGLQHNTVLVTRREIQKAGVVSDAV